MKDNKFRVFLHNNHNHPTGLIYPEKISFTSDNQVLVESKWLKNDNPKFYELSFKLSAILDDKDIVMRYTGLKDCCGIDIYEGDIFADEHTEEYGKVHFDDGAFYISWLTHTELLGEINSIFEVVGNIYENPDLLKSN